MKINADKFQFIVCGKVDGTGEITIANQSIMPENSVKLLGIYVDNKLNFNVHISYIVRKPVDK